MGRDGALLGATTLVRFTVRQKWLGQPATAQNVVPAAAGYVIPDAGLRILQARLRNGGASAAAGAIVALLQDGQWIAGQWVNATTTFTDDTADAQDGDTNDVALETLTSGDGILVGANLPFGALSLDITTAGAATASVHLLEYWNGTAWTAIAAAGTLVDIPRSAVWALGESLVLFEPPVDWAKGGSGTNVPQTTYNIRIRSTPTTPTVAALARRLYVGQILVSQDAVAANGEVERTWRPDGLELRGSTGYAALGAALATADEGSLLEAVVEPWPAYR